MSARKSTKLLLCKQPFQRLLREKMPAANGSHAICARGGVYPIAHALCTRFDGDGDGLRALNMLCLGLRVFGGSVRCDGRYDLGVSLLFAICGLYGEDMSEGYAAAARRRSSMAAKHGLDL